MSQQKSSVEVFGMAKRKKQFGRIELPKGKTANDRAKERATWPGLKDASPAARIATRAVKAMREAKVDRAKFICPSCGMDTQRVNCVPGLLFECQNCNASLAVQTDGDMVASTTPETKLDASDVATILAALRLFQKEYEDFDSVSIADAWPMHFNVQGDGDDIAVEPEPLGSIRIDDLCERINCAKVLTID
jgi:hypothetical protein